MVCVCDGCAGPHPVDDDRGCSVRVELGNTTECNADPEGLGPCQFSFYYEVRSPEKDVRQRCRDR